MPRSKSVDESEIRRSSRPRSRERDSSYRGQRAMEDSSDQQVPSTFESVKRPRGRPPKRRILYDPSDDPHGASNPKKKATDYCWLCHEGWPIIDDLDQKCESCFRVYHHRCLGPNYRFTDDMKHCPECRGYCVDGTDSFVKISHKDLVELLQLVLSRLRPLYPEFRNWNTAYVTNVVITMMDFNIVEDRLNMELVSTIADFYADIKRIVHNCYIIYGANHGITNKAKLLMKSCREELIEIEACPECYLKAHFSESDSFVEVCTNQHILVWAKMKGFPYWPAKVMKVIEGVANVWFFGSHDKSKVAVSNCIVLSKEASPNKKVRNKKSYDVAMKELGVYIKNAVKQFGNYQCKSAITLFRSQHPSGSVKQTPGSKTKRGRPSKTRNSCGERIDAIDLSDDESSLDLEIIEPPTDDSRSDRPEAEELWQETIEFNSSEERPSSDCEVLRSTPTRKSFCVETIEDTPTATSDMEANTRSTEESIDPVVISSCDAEAISEITNIDPVTEHYTDLYPTDSMEMSIQKYTQKIVPVVHTVVGEMYADLARITSIEGMEKMDLQKKIEDLQKVNAELTKQNEEVTSNADVVVERLTKTLESEKTTHDEDRNLWRKEREELEDRMKMEMEETTSKLLVKMEDEKKKIIESYKSSSSFAEEVTQKIDEAVNSAKTRWETLKKEEINETKRYQWCASCKKRASYYCCWNTSYCDKTCQLEHWSSHMTVCESKAVVSPSSPRKVMQKLKRGHSLMPIPEGQKVYSKPRHISSGQLMPPPPPPPPLLPQIAAQSKRNYVPYLPNIRGHIRSSTSAFVGRPNVRHGMRPLQAIPVVKSSKPVATPEVSSPSTSSSTSVDAEKP